MKLKEQYVQMSWVLLEYELIYFNRTVLEDVIDIDWIRLRSISDEIYDEKLAAFEKIAKKLGEKPRRPVGIGMERPAVKAIVEKFKRVPLSEGAVPISWPDPSTETMDELNYRIRHQVFNSEKIAVKNKAKAIIKKSS